MVELPTFIGTPNRPMSYTRRTLSTPHRLNRIGLCLLTLSALWSIAVTSAYANDYRADLRLSIGNSWQALNEVQIPNDDEGTRFSLDEAVGPGPVTAVRFELNWAINDRHGVRIMLAPLSYTETVTFENSIQFMGAAFEANQPLDATYRFNSWRVGYHYTLKNDPTTTFRVGGTLKIRDAEIRLQQGETDSGTDNIGAVPLIYLAYEYRFSNGWSLAGDIDALGGGRGRAIDAGVKLDYALTEQWRIGSEFRVLDGGVDGDTYNFARFNSATLSISTRF